jgi:hypothetical protein
MLCFVIQNPYTQIAVLLVVKARCYRLVQSGKTASGGCSAGQGSSEL